MVFLILLFGFSSAFAVGRIIPNDLIFVQIRDVDIKTFEVKLLDANDGFFKKIYKSPYTVKMTKGIRIKDEKNKWVVWGKFAGYKNSVAGVRFTNAGQLNEVMILSEEEILKNIDKIRAQNWKGELKK